MKEETIVSELQKFKDKRSYDRNYYHNVIKQNPDKLNRRRQQAKEYMATRKDISKKRYQEKRETILIKNQYNYYKRKDRLQDFKVKDTYKRGLELKIISPID